MTRLLSPGMLGADMACAGGGLCCNGGEYCVCKREAPAKSAEGWTYPPNRPNIYSSELPPWPTIEEIKKAVRDELKKAGVI